MRYEDGESVQIDFPDPDTIVEEGKSVRKSVARKSKHKEGSKAAVDEILRAANEEVRMG